MLTFLAPSLTSSLNATPPLVSTVRNNRKLDFLEVVGCYGWYSISINTFIKLVSKIDNGP